jgi:hypothetical protein
VAVERPEGPYHPGETVNVTATLDTSRELKIRSGRAAPSARRITSTVTKAPTQRRHLYDTMWSQDRTGGGSAGVPGETVFPAGNQEIYHFTFTLP